MYVLTFTKPNKTFSYLVQICSYFTDPQNCIGPVAVNRVFSAMEHTAGEKRLSGHPDDFLHLKK
jgi:hypothetical protein